MRNMYPNALHTELKLVTEVLEERMEHLYGHFKSDSEIKGNFENYKSLSPLDFIGYEEIFV